MTNTFEQLQDKIALWAEEKAISDSQNFPKQFMKVVEELGELSSAILKGKRREEYDAFGDVLVTIIILAEQRGVNLVEALHLAYEEIKERTGKTIDGTFVKE